MRRAARSNGEDRGTPVVRLGMHRGLAVLDPSHTISRGRRGAGSGDWNIGAVSTTISGMTEASPMLELDGVTRGYDTGDGRMDVLRGISLAVDALGGLSELEQLAGHFVLLFDSQS